MGGDGSFQANEAPTRETDRSLGKSMCIIFGFITVGVAFVTGAVILADHLIKNPGPTAAKQVKATMQPTSSTHPSHIPTTPPTYNISDSPTLSPLALFDVGNPMAGVTSDGWFGNSISLSSEGKRIAVGSNNHVQSGATDQIGLAQVYELGEDGNWTQIGDNIYGKSGGNKFGNHVSLSFNGDQLAVSAFNPYPGYIRTYESVNGTWVRRGQELIGSSMSLSHDGLTIAVAGENDAKLYQYDNENSSWASFGNGINEDSPVKIISLSGDGKTMALGAPFDDELAANSGRVRVFKLDNINGELAQVGPTIYGRVAQESLGSSLALSYDGSVVAVGSMKTSIVKVMEFDIDTNKWAQLANNINGDNSSFGWSISLSQNGDRILIGAPWYKSSVGRTEMYRLDKRRFWVQVNHINGGEADEFEGWDVSMSPEGGYVATGARKANINGLEDNGRVSVYQLK